MGDYSLSKQVNVVERKIERKIERLQVQDIGSTIGGRYHNGAGKAHLGKAELEGWVACVDVRKLFFSVGGDSL